MPHLVREGPFRPHIRLYERFHTERVKPVRLSPNPSCKGRVKNEFCVENVHVSWTTEWKQRKEGLFFKRRNTRFLVRPQVSIITVYYSEYLLCSLLVQDSWPTQLVYSDTTLL